MQSDAPLRVPLSFDELYVGSSATQVVLFPGTDDDVLAPSVDKRSASCV